MKATRNDALTPVDGPVVRYIVGGCEIRASKHGVSVHGYWPLKADAESTDQIHLCLAKAAIQHVRLSVNKVCVHDGAQPYTEDELEAILESEHPGEIIRLPFLN